MGKYVNSEEILRNFYCFTRMRVFQNAVMEVAASLNVLGEKYGGQMQTMVDEWEAQEASLKKELDSTNKSYTVRIEHSAIWMRYGRL